tara:strand:- start:9610 stop:10605 length:996 start_codon:yes stop_codon:yes gene_type:complete
MVLKIAEAGVNHNGSLKLAKDLIDIAADAGADIVKFQTFQAESLVVKDTAKAPYQKSLTNEKTQFEMLKKLELSRENFSDLYTYSKKKKIEFLSTAFDVDSLDFLVDLGIKRIKIPSGEITNFLLLKRAAYHKLPIILSTGMSSMKEIREAVQALFRFKVKKKDLSMLHCTTQYPAPIDSLNLSCIQTLKDSFNITVGYSDHSEGVNTAQIVTALGAKIVEKHFTKSNRLKGPDHKASLEPKELKKYFELIDLTERSLGSSKKQINKQEKENILPARKSIVANCRIRKGEVFTEANLNVKRPGGGISPMKWEKIIGRKAKREFREDDQISI